MKSNRKERQHMIKGKSLCFLAVLILLVLPSPLSALAGASNGIAGNGTGGIWIDINAHPYTYYQGMPTWGQYAYTESGCAWFATSRASQITGKTFNQIYSGSSWYNSMYNTYGFSRGSSLQAKALACWEGHVSVVESVSGNTVTISEGGNNYYSNSSNGYCNIRTVSPSFFANDYQYGKGTWLGFVYLGAETSSSVTASWTNTVEFTDDHNAGIKGEIRTSAPVQFQEAGVYVWDDRGNLIAQKSEGTSVSGSYMYVTYNIIADMGVELNSGRDYTYQFWAKAGGNVYYGEKAAFRTGGPTTYDPEGYADGITGKDEMISINGWAFDRDDASAHLQIHIYVGGPAGSGAKFYSTCAENERRDLAPLGCGTDHGFKTDIKIEEGTYPVYVYAINVGYGNHVLLGTKTVSVSSHAYQFAGWSHDMSKTPPDGIARFKCSRCNDIQEVKASVSSQILVQATCTSKGRRSITSRAVFAGKVYTDKMEQEIPITHTWNSSYTVDKAATYTEAGSKSIHCKNCNAVKPGSQLTIPKLTEPSSPKPSQPSSPKPTQPVSPAPVSNASVQYHTHVQSYGWQNWVSNGTMSGTSGKAKRLEGIEIRLQDQPVSGSIQYRTHVQSYGWESGWKADGAMSGTSGKAKRLEAIQIRLTGAMAERYDVYYRVHAQSFGWLGWAKNGASAGTEGHGKRLEGIEIRLVAKGGAAPGSTANAFVKAGSSPSSGDSRPSGNVAYHTHVQSYGWQNWVSEGAMSGTSGQAKRLEGIEIKLQDQPVSGSIQYRTHIQSYGWEGNWKADGAMSGTSGKAKRLEAIQIRLTGKMAEQYDVYYRVHAQSFGWLGWAKNGASAGTAGHAKRLEGIEIRLVKKGGAAPGSTSRSFVQK